MKDFKFLMNFEGMRLRAEVLSAKSRKGAISIKEFIYLLIMRCLLLFLYTGN